jgi:anti-sigma factor (TIGR02949 family)
MADRKMTCDEVLGHLLAFLDREMDSHTAAEIERHLEECRGCYSRAEFERKLKSHVRAAGSRTAPERLRERIRRLIERF